MNEKKTGQTYSCDVCKIDIFTEAEYALHEFSKKHCYNLVKLSRNKPVVPKTKTKVEVTKTVSDTEEKGTDESSGTNTVACTGSIAKYGYFVPGEIYNANAPKEFNTEYNPYLQKYAENPYKQTVEPVPDSGAAAIPPVETGSLPNSGRKKKKKIKTCQICNVTLTNLHEYETHMKSPQHIWKLKVSGMGVSAHFVKASTDLHTTDSSESNSCQESQEHTTDSISQSTTQQQQQQQTFPTLFCDVCDLMLNSPQQYASHVSGKAHLECVEKKSELTNPVTSQLYCFSCKLSLNNLNQYNEHKSGKKHKVKCKQLMREGITIPPEERLPDWPVQRVNPSEPIKYPKLYEKYILDKQRGNTLQVENSPGPGAKAENPTSHHLLTEANVTESKSHALGPPQGTPVAFTPTVESTEVTTAKREAETDKSETSNNTNSMIRPFVSETSEMTGMNKDLNSEDSNGQLVVLKEAEYFTCDICNGTYWTQSEFDRHFHGEDHLTHILRLKLKGTADDRILNLTFAQSNKVKSDPSGKFVCTVCTVTANDLNEYQGHLNSLVHGYAQREFRQKRAIEVKNLTASDDRGVFPCRLCLEEFKSLPEFCQHLHMARHKQSEQSERTKKVMAKRKGVLVRKQKLLKESGRGWSGDGTPTPDPSLRDPDVQVPEQQGRIPDTRIGSGTDAAVNGPLRRHFNSKRHFYPTTSHVRQKDYWSVSDEFGCPSSRYSGSMSPVDNQNWYSIQGGRPYLYSRLPAPGYSHGDMRFWRHPSKWRRL